MQVRHFLSLADIEPEELHHLIDKSLAFAAGRQKHKRPLKGKTVGIYFRRPSTRTRTAFTVGALKLGAQVLQYGPNDLQIVTGESMRDTGRILGGFLDLLVVRTNDSPAEMQDLANQAKMSVINAMSENEHPTQAIADLVTIREALGRLNDLHVFYIGEGNNTTAALAFALAKTKGMQLTIITPENYGLPLSLIESARDLARKNNSYLEQRHGLEDLPRNVDVVYTTRWCTMGVPKADSNWREKFDPYCVTPSLMLRVSKASGTIFLHDLPAMRGIEVTDEVLDGPQSVAFRQAEHKLTSAMAIMDWCAQSHA